MKNTASKNLPVMLLILDEWFRGERFLGLRHARSEDRHRLIVRHFMADDLNFIPAEWQFLAAIETDDFVRRIKGSRRALAVTAGDSGGPKVMPAAEHFPDQTGHFMFLLYIWSLLLTGV